jgi:hypothetical protein
MRENQGLIRVVFGKKRSIETPVVDQKILTV